jgi:hypothetical protein
VYLIIYVFFSNGYYKSLQTTLLVKYNLMEIWLTTDRTINLENSEIHTIQLEICRNEYLEGKYETLFNWAKNIITHWLKMEGENYSQYQQRVPIAFWLEIIWINDSITIIQCTINSNWNIEVFRKGGERGIMAIYIL